MAVTKREANIHTFHPVWPDTSSWPADRWRVTYDRPTDTLFVDFGGTALPGASLPLDRGDRDYLFLGVEPDTNTVVGLQIEHFLSYAVGQHPELAGALDVASVDIERSDPDRISHFRPRRAAQADPAALLEDLRRLSA